jgi:hypothetical protein
MTTYALDQFFLPRFRGYMEGLGAALSHVVTGAIVQAAGIDVGFAILAAVATAAFAVLGLAMPETHRTPAGPHSDGVPGVALIGPAAPPEL